MFLLDCPWLECMVDVEKLNSGGTEGRTLEIEAILVFLDRLDAGEAEHWNIGAALGPMRPNSVRDQHGRTYLYFSFQTVIRAKLYSESFASQ